jgi:hypothetical protein
MRQGGRRIELEAGCMTGVAGRKRRGREVEPRSGGGRGLKEEAGRWIKGLEVEED